MKGIMTNEQRDSLFETISNLSELNRIMNNQARKIELRDGEYWKMLDRDVIEEKVLEYDKPRVPE